MSTPSRAEALRSLHQGPGILVLPNAWDAGSAILVESAGAKAIATTSAGVAWSLGYPDGDALPVPLLAEAVGRIARVVSVPVSVDSEGGYSDDPAEAAANVGRLIEAGAAGVNLEDGVGPPERLCAKIEQVKALAAGRGADVFVNARVDLYLRRLLPPEAAAEETIARAARYIAAGADGVFVPGLADPAVIGALAEAIPAPLNLMATPALPPLAELSRLGVRRVSMGPALTLAAYSQAKRLAEDFLAHGDPAALAGSGITYPEINGRVAEAARG